MARLRAARAGGGYERWERWTNAPLLVLALILLAVLLLPFVVRLTPAERDGVDTVGTAIWAVFVVDYLARLYLAPRRLRFVRSHVFDLAIVLLPPLRPLRALALLRIASAAGVVQERAQRSLHARVTTYAVAVAVLIVGAAATAVVNVERDAQAANIRTLSQGLWWAVTTVTTVGYGDHYPTTAPGRMIAIGLMMVGVVLLGVVTATIAAWFVDRLRAVAEAERETAETERQAAQTERQAEETERQAERTEQQTEQMLSAVLDELRRLRTRLDELEAGRPSRDAGGGA